MYLAFPLIYGDLAFELTSVKWTMPGVKKGSFYIAQYPVRWTAKSALHFLPSMTDLFVPTPTRLLREAF